VGVALWVAAVRLGDGPRGVMHRGKVEGVLFSAQGGSAKCKEDEEEGDAENALRPRRLKERPTPFGAPAHRGRKGRNDQSAIIKAAIEG